MIVKASTKLKKPKKGTTQVVSPLPGGYFDVRTFGKKARRKYGWFPKRGKHGEYVLKGKKLPTKVFGDDSAYYNIGLYHGYLAQLQKVYGGVFLYVGCHVFINSTSARKHWRGNTNPQGVPRPRAKELIAKAIATAKALGWDWK